MTESNRPARWRLGLLAFAIALPAFAHDRLRTIGTPPGIVLPPTTEVVPPAPTWAEPGYKGGVGSGSHPLAAPTGAQLDALTAASSAGSPKPSTNLLTLSSFSASLRPIFI